MGEPWWTLGMAAAWIIWRTPTAVRRVWSEYRSKVIEWRGPVCYRQDESGYGYKVVVEEAELGHSSFGNVIVKEYHLVPQSQFNLFDVLAAAALESPEDGKVFVEGPNARNDLWRLLQSGTLIAEGIPTDRSERRPIRDAEWVDLDYFDQPGWLSDSIGVILENRERYRSVRVRSEDVTRLWIDPRLRDIISPPRPKLPPTVSPTGGGFMPLYCAAQWVASKGGNEEFDPLDLPRWKTAYSELLARLASDDIRVIGKANGMREPVAGFNFVACPIDYPFQETNMDLHCGSELYLRSYPYLGDEQWSRGMDDSLRVGHKARWTSLVVDRPAVARFWAFGPAHTESPVELAKTGAAGRPTVMHILRNELAERQKAGQIETSLAEQVRVLRQWFAKQYPNLPCPAPTTTGNGLRAQYRSAQTPRN